MVKAWILGLLAGCLGLAGHAGAYVNDITNLYKAGEHTGEVKQLAVDLEFSGAIGDTVTDAGGINYNFWGMTFHDNQVYPQQYWGDFPLYFFGGTVGATVTVSNLGPRATENLMVTTQVFVLNTDGSSGVSLAPDKVTQFSVAKGQTQTIDASFVPQFVPGASSGLDRVVILVQHINDGGGPGNSYPALIVAKEAILCPPSLQTEAAAKKH
jgi:hypothetical protein